MSHDAKFCPLKGNPPSKSGPCCGLESHTFSPFWGEGEKRSYSVVHVEFHSLGDLFCLFKSAGWARRGGGGGSHEVLDEPPPRPPQLCPLAFPCRSPHWVPSPSPQCLLGIRPPSPSRWGPWTADWPFPEVPARPHVRGCWAVPALCGRSQVPLPSILPV